MNEKLKHLKNFIKNKNESYAILLFNNMLQSLKERDVINASYILLFKLSAQTGFLCWNQTFLFKYELDSPTELKDWIRNLIHYLSKELNNYLYLPQLFDLYGSLIKSIRLFHTDNDFFLRHEKIKSDLIVHFPTFIKNHYLLKLSFNIFYCLQCNLDENTQMEMCFHFHRYCILFLTLNPPSQLWKLFSIYIKNNISLSSNIPFNKWFSILREIVSSVANEKNKFKAIHRDLIMAFGCRIIFRISDQSEWLQEVQNENSTTFVMMQPKPFNAKENKFRKKFPAYSPLFNRKIAGESLFEIMSNAYEQYSKISNFSVKEFIEGKMKILFPMDDYGTIIMEQQDEINNFQLDMIDPFLFRGYPDSPWKNSIQMVEPNFLIPGIYKTPNGIVCGSFLNDEITLINAWFHFLLMMDANKVHQFAIREGKFSRYYTIHESLSLIEPIKIAEKKKREMLLYFVGMYLIGYPSTFYPNDIVIDANFTIFYSGIFRKETIDVLKGRSEALEQIQKHHFFSSEILDFTNCVKESFLQEKNQIYLKDYTLHNLIGIGNWIEALNELSKQFIYNEEE